MTASIAALSPYKYRRTDPRQRRMNIGDGFILRAIERQIGPFRHDHVLTSRRAPFAAERQMLEKSSHVVMAGANQLQDDFKPWPGLSPEAHRHSSLRVVPFGVGLAGRVGGGGVTLTANALEHLRIIHERSEFSSWRCPRTVAILDRALPELKGRFLMTLCPVVLDRPLLQGKSFPDRDGTIAVTITDRGPFWEREVPMLQRVAQRYPKSRRLLVLHQDASPILASRLNLDRLGLPRRWVGEKIAIRQFARELGYEVVKPRSGDEGIALYRDQVDLHFGSRLHAHLLMLSLNKKTFLITVDERMNGFSEYLGFPLCDPERIDSYVDFDFEPLRAKAQEAASVMARFVKSLGLPPRPHD
jgi:hypothetical protein